MLAAIKVARRLELEPSDVVVTVATDSAALYVSERDKWQAEHLPAGFDEVSAGEIFGAHLAVPNEDHVLETTQTHRKRIFNLGYFTWVEQQGVALADFDRRKRQEFWRDLRGLLPVWDELIEKFNRETGLAN